MKKVERKRQVYALLFLTGDARCHIISPYVPGLALSGGKAVFMR